MYTRWWMAGSKPLKPIVRLALCVTLILSLSLSAGCSLLPKEDAEEALPTITPPKLSEKPTVLVKTETIEIRESGIGKIVSEQEETLFFNDIAMKASPSARIKDIYVESGDAVQQGQLLAELDVADKVRELRRVKLEFRKEELKLIEILRKAEDYEPEELEQFKIDFELKKTSILDLEEAIANAQLTAPFSGTVISISKKRGATIQAYEPVVMVADLNQLTVAAELTADALRNVAIGMDTLVTINAAGTHKGQIRRLPTITESNNESDPNKQKDDVVIELERWPESVTRGTPLSIAVIINRKENVVVIPPSTLRSFNGRSYVQVVDDAGNKREVDVEVGLKTATQVEIVKGLVPGQKVVGR
jgi:macrolide-specific efflux system membrane fusion protein